MHGSDDATILVSFGEWVRQRRKALDLTQRALAEGVSCATVTIQKIESDERRPSRDLALLLARQLAVPEEQQGIFLQVARAESAVAHLDAPGRPAMVQAPEPGEPPYQGLRQFEEGDAARYFGREALAATLVDRLDESPFLAVIGPSGSGKSSLLRAGLIPLLRRRAASGPPDSSVDILLLTPSARPLQALATVLARESTPVAATARLMDDMLADERSLALVAARRLHRGQADRLVLVIDQFEEVFTLCDREAERSAFVANLLYATLPDAGLDVRVVIALRADFYAHCAPYPALRERVSRHQIFIGSMETEELRRVIEAPAERGGWLLEPGLVTLILEEIGNEPGRLPLLSHVLLATWERRSGRMLTLAGYRAAGGVSGALSRTAERVLHDELKPEEQEVARRIFLQLTEPGEDAPDTRRRAALAELVTAAGDATVVASVLDRLAAARLVTTGSDSVEIAHEALIREWPTLRAWLDEDRDALRLRRHLESSAHAWEELERDPGELYRGARLAQAQEWLVEHGDYLGPLEREFLSASRERAEAQTAKREARRQRELEAERARATQERAAAAALHRRAVFLTTALIAAALLATLAFAQFRTATAEARVATSRELAVAAINNLVVDPELSILLALEAYDRAPTIEAEDALHRALAFSRVERVLSGHEGTITDVLFSPDGATLATAGSDGNTNLWDGPSGELLGALAGHEDEVTALSFHPDGTLLASASLDGSVRLWDLERRTEVTQLDHASPVVHVEFSPDGRLLATAEEDGSAHVWAVDDGTLEQTLQGPTRSLAAVRFSPDGSRLMTTGGDSTAVIWNLASGEIEQSITLNPNGPAFAISHGSFHPSGRQVALVGQDGVAIWDLAANELAFSLLGHTSIVSEVHYARDGRRLVTSSADGSARVWDAQSGRELLAFVGHGTAILSVSLSQDGAQLATGAQDGTVRLWNAHYYTREHVTMAHPAGVAGVAYRADGKQVATAGVDGRIRTWEPDKGTQVAELAGPPARVLSVAYNPDGTVLASAGEDGAVRLWDVERGELVHTIEAHEVGDRYGGFLTGALYVAFDPDGSKLASAGADGSARLWDAATGEALLTVRHEEGGIARLLFSPDGRFVTAGEDGTVRFWDRETGEEQQRFARPTTLWGLAISPDGRLLAASDLRGTAVWDLASGEIRHVLVGYGGILNALAFSPDGNMLAGGSTDGRAHLWEMAGGREILQLPGHLRTIFALDFSPDGRLLTTASLDATARSYLMRPEELVAAAESRLTRTLTDKECFRFLHQPACPTS